MSGNFASSVPPSPSSSSSSSPPPLLGILRMTNVPATNIMKMSQMLIQFPTESSTISVSFSDICCDRYTVKSKCESNLCSSLCAASFCPLMKLVRAAANFRCRILRWCSSTRSARHRHDPSRLVYLYGTQRQMYGHRFHIDARALIADCRSALAMSSRLWIMHSSSHLR